MNALGIKFYAYIGRAPAKKIRGQEFLKGVPSPVWDKKVQRLMQRLPYMREVEAPPAMVSAVKQAEAALPKKQVVIPDNWRDMHHKKRVSWARTLSGRDITKVVDADEVLLAHKGASIPRTPAPVNATAMAEANG